MKKLLSMLAASVLLLLLLVGCGESKETYDEIVWPTSELASQVPVPSSLVGEINYDSETYLWVDVYEITEDEFDSYIEDCKAAGFTVDYWAYDDYYSADNQENYSLTLNFDPDENCMTLTITLLEEEENIDEAEEVTDDLPEDVDELVAEEEEEDTEVKESIAETEESESVDGIRPDFKEAMDNYEAFIDEYVEFMKKYAESDDATGMLMDYLEYMQTYAEMAETIDGMNQDDLTNEELAYYIDVTARVTQKLLEVAA